MASMKTRDPVVDTDMVIEGQGSVPYAKTENVPNAPAPVRGFTSKGQRAGEMTARGFGLQMRATKFVLR